MRHTHYAASISFRGKVDSFNVRCWCGAEEIVATWHYRSPKGWSQRQWPLLRTAGMAMIDSVFSAQRSMRNI